MKKNKKTGKWNVPFEMQKNAYNVRKVSFLAFFCICVIAACLVAQMFLYERTASERMLSETAAQRAGMFEEVFDKAKTHLVNLKTQITEKSKGTFPEDDSRSGEGRFFKSVDKKKISSVFSEASDVDKSGMFFDDDILNLYLIVDEENVLVAEIDNGYFAELAELSGSYGDVAEHILFDSGSGKILVNTGERYGFDGTSIGFLKGFDFEKTNGANRMFSRVANKLSGYTVIKNAVGQRFSFAYEPVNDSGLYLLQFLPETELENSAFRSMAPFFAGIVLLIGGALLFTVWICSVTKKIAYDTAAESYNGNVMKILLMQMAESSLASMFVYYRDTDELTVFRDREGLHSDGHTKKDALSYLGEYYGHGVEDIRRLKNAIALAGPHKSIKLELACGTDGDTSVLEYTLSGVKNECGGRKDAVVCTVLENNREAFGFASKADGMAFAEDSIYKTTGIEILLERNSWRFLWNNEECFSELKFGTQVRNNYDADIEKSISPFVISKDRQMFLTTLSRLNLLESYRNGTTDSCIKYRINTGGGIYEYRMLDIHMYRDGKTDEIKANLYVRHMGRACPDKTRKS